MCFYCVVQPACITGGILILILQYRGTAPRKLSGDSGRIGNLCSSSRLPWATGCPVLVRWSRISAWWWNAADPRSIPLLPHYTVIRAVCLSRPQGSSEEGCLITSAVTAQHATASVIGATGTWILTDRCSEHDYCSSLHAATVTYNNSKSEML